MRLATARIHDLSIILRWLRLEYQANGEGFYCNKSIIERSFEEDGDLWVGLIDSDPVAFQVGNYSADILCVKEGHQRKGYGSAFVKASLERALCDGKNVLYGECAPLSSLPFWLKHGFTKYSNQYTEGRILVRRLVDRTLPLPSGLSSVIVSISFYPEEVRSTKGLAPISSWQVTARLNSRGDLLFPKRLIAFKEDEPKRQDLMVRVEVDGRELYFSKAKYPEALSMGVKQDSSTFFIDSILRSDTPGRAAPL